MNNSAIEALASKRQKLIDEKNKMISKFDFEISELETAIEIISGKKVWEFVNKNRFDDENYNYVRSSQEEI
jgi:hypothetical protein